MNNILRILTFLQVLEIIYEKGIHLDRSFRELEKLSPMDMSADKVKVICKAGRKKKFVLLFH